MSDILLVSDASPMQTLLAEIGDLLERLPDAPSQLVDALIDALESSSEVARVESLPTLRAGELRLGLYPSYRLLEAVSALRTLDGNLSVGI
jgi:hypothetical protein